MPKCKLTFKKRQMLEKMHKSGIGVTAIAKALEVSRETIYRELERGGTPYRAINAQKSL